MSFPFVVAGLAYNIVLGHDFLQQYGAVIDVRQQFVDFSLTKSFRHTCHSVQGSTVGRFYQILPPDDIISVESKEVSSVSLRGGGG